MWTQLTALATKLGVISVPVAHLKTSLAVGIVRRMRPRSGTNVYQSAAFSLQNFPREAALKILPVESLVTPEEATTVTWRFDLQAEALQFFGRLLPLGGRTCSGLSVACLTKSELEVRTVAFMLTPIEISYVLRQGIDTLYVNFNYALVDDFGQVHPPKDSERRELDISHLVPGVRSQALLDLAGLATKEAPLSAAFWRQLGVESKAQEVEAYLHNTQTPDLKKAKRQRLLFEVEAVLEVKRAKVLVRWNGYHQSWEAWRIRGEAGSPLETWEPLHRIKQTCAYQEWEAALHSSHPPP